jgi:hypothetical protein
MFTLRSALSYFTLASSHLSRLRPPCARRRILQNDSVNAFLFEHRCSSLTSPCGSVSISFTIVLFSFSTRLTCRVLVLFARLTSKNLRAWPRQTQSIAAPRARSSLSCALDCRPADCRQTESTSRCSSSCFTKRGFLFPRRLLAFVDLVTSPSRLKHDCQRAHNL